MKVKVIYHPVDAKQDGIREFSGCQWAAKSRILMFKDPALECIAHQFTEEEAPKFLAGEKVRGGPFNAFVYQLVRS